MLTIEGIYKNGRIVLTETPAEVVESKVLVTFLDANPDAKKINLPERGIGKERAAELRAGFGAIVDDWNRSEMDIYDVD